MAFLRNRLSVLGAAALALSLVACDKTGTKTDESAAKSLDNFAAGKTVTVNQCKGTQTDAAVGARWDARINFEPALKSSLSQAAQDRYKTRVKEYLAAIPLEIQKAYLDFGGQITLTSQAAAVCASGFEDPSKPNYVADARRDLESCYVFARGAGADANKQVMSVFHQVSAADAKDSFDANDKRIAHGGVRVFMGAFAQFFTRMNANDNTAEVAEGLKFKFANADSVKISGLKRKAASAFLVDIVKGKKYDLASLETLLGVGSAAALKGEILDANGNLKSGLSAVDLLSKATFKRSATDAVSAEQRAAREAQFQDFVAMEGLDSVECSDATQAVLAADFSGAKPHLEALRDALVEHARGMTVVSGGANLTEQAWETQTGSPTPSEGMQLTQGFYSGEQMMSRCQGCGCNCQGQCQCQGCQCCNGGCCCNQQPQPPTQQPNRPGLFQNNGQVAAAPAPVPLNPAMLTGGLALITGLLKI